MLASLQVQGRQMSMSACHVTKRLQKAEGQPSTSCACDSFISRAHALLMRSSSCTARKVCRRTRFSAAASMWA